MSQYYHHLYFDRYIRNKSSSHKYHIDKQSHKAHCRYHIRRLDEKDILDHKTS